MSGWNKEFISIIYTVQMKKRNSSHLRGVSEDTPPELNKQ